MVTITSVTLGVASESSTTELLVVQAVKIVAELSANLANKVNNYIGWIPVQITLNYKKILLSTWLNQITILDFLKHRIFIVSIIITDPMEISDTRQKNIYHINNMEHHLPD